MGRKIITVGFFAMVLWYMALKSNAIELSARFYRDFPFCIWSFVGAIAGSYVIFVLSDELINKIPLIRELLIFCGKKFFGDAVCPCNRRSGDKLAEYY